jgi:hypothetical protein
MEGGKEGGWERERGWKQGGERGKERERGGRGGSGMCWKYIRR